MVFHGMENAAKVVPFHVKIAETFSIAWKNPVWQTSRGSPHIGEAF